MYKDVGPNCTYIDKIIQGSYTIKQITKDLSLKIPFKIVKSNIECKTNIHQGKMNPGNLLGAFLCNIIL